MNILSVYSIICHNNLRIGGFIPFVQIQNFWQKKKSFPYSRRLREVGGPAFDLITWILNPGLLTRHHG